MEAERPSADVVAANVINGVMLIACGLAVCVAGAAACVQILREGAEGDWDLASVNGPLVLFALSVSPRLIRMGLDLIRKRAQREAA